MGTAKKDNHPTVSKLKNLYEEGKLEQAVILAKMAEQEHEKLKKNVTFLMTSVKILLEAEGPTSRVKNLLTQANLIDPENGEIADYFDIAEGRSLANHQGFPQAEKLLRSVLRRSPNNPHALFLLGSQLFHLKGDVPEAIRFLERCVTVRPNLLRAWGCLAVIYVQNGNSELAERAFRKCVALETNPNMKKFFSNQLAAIRGFKMAA